MQVHTLPVEAMKLTDMQLVRLGSHRHLPSFLQNLVEAREVTSGSHRILLSFVASATSK